MGTVTALRTPTAEEDIAFLEDYYAKMRETLVLNLERIDQIRAARDLWAAAKARGGKVIFAGNGGSSGIASHLAIDLGKNGHIPALCFGDTAMVTCLANDYGYENWLAHAIRIQGKPEDVLVAISSSGKSPNILNGVKQAQSMGMKVVTLSGMAENNPLRQLGDVNFWVDSRGYNIIETAHQAYLMSVIDLVIGKAEYPAS